MRIQIHISKWIFILGNPQSETLMVSTILKYGRLHWKSRSSSTYSLHNQNSIEIYRNGQEKSAEGKRERREFCIRQWCQRSKFRGSDISDSIGSIWSVYMKIKLSGYNLSCFRSGWKVLIVIIAQGIRHARWTVLPNVQVLVRHLINRSYTMTPKI